MEGLTFDTGALIALERRKQRMSKVLHLARLRKIPITVPSAVVAEWWRGQSGQIALLLRGVTVEPLSELLAKLAGEALASTRTRNAIDAIVVASAAQRGDIVYTSDIEDLTRFREVFPAVRILKA
jgi:predicted nucleic acid-binding protein